MYYRLIPPEMRREEHHYSMMYRLSRTGINLDEYRPKINLRSRPKTKFNSQRSYMEGQK